MRHHLPGGAVAVAQCGFIAATACVAVPRSRVPAAPQAGAACHTPWQRLNTLSGDGREQWYVESAQIVETPWGVLLLGSPSARTQLGLAIEDTPQSVGLLLDRNYRAHRLPGPETRARPLYPRGGMDASHRLHLVWGEGREVSGEFPRIARLMHATFDGRRWTTPAVIVEAPGIAWFPTSSSRVAPFGGGVVVAVGTEQPGIPKPTIVALNLDSAWIIRQVLTPLWAGYPEVLEAAQGRLALAFVSASLGREPDQNSLFVTTSSDSGRTWLAPSRVYRGGGGGAYQPRLLAGDSVLYLAWNQEGDAGPGSDALGLAISRDTGRTWEGQTTQVIARGVSQAQWSIADGVPHATITSYAFERPLHYAWSRIGWEECQRPPSGELLGHSMASVHGRLTMVTSEREQQSRTPISALYSLP